MPKFEIRKATTKDIDALVERRHAMFDEMVGAAPEERKIASESYRKWAREMMKRKLFHGYIVTAKNGKIAASGCVWLREVQPSHDQPARLVPYLMSIYTDPEFRRNGLASLIVEEAMTWAKRKGYDKMTLHASSVGRKVYAKLGWERTREMEVHLTPRPPQRRGSSTRSSGS